MRQKQTTFNRTPSLIATRRSTFTISYLFDMNTSIKVSLNLFRVFSAQCHSRLYSVYPTHFMDPLSNKLDIENFMKDKDGEEIEGLSVKAAPYHLTGSVFFDPDVHLLSQYLMRKGDRILARNLVEKTFINIKRLQLNKYLEAKKKEKVELNPRIIFHKALENTTPVLTTKFIIRNGTAYKIPTMIMPKRAKFLAMKFLLDSAREKGTKDKIWDTLAQELINAAENKGKAVQKKIELHKYCEANRAYAHYRWT